MIPVIGVDPGGQTSGLVLREGDTLMQATLVSNETPGTITAVYLHEVTRAVSALLAEIGYEAGERPLIGLEDLTHPSPHLGLANVMGLLGTAQVIGAVQHCYHHLVVMVPPAKHGSAPLRAYPPALVGDREKGTYGSGKLRHARSAWDIAGATKAAALRECRA